MENSVCAFITIYIVLLQGIAHCQRAQYKPGFWPNSRPPLRVPEALVPHFPQFIIFNNTLSRQPRQALREEAREIMPGVYSCGMQGDDIFINFVNPHYPNHDSVAGTCTFRMIIAKPEICQVRVDFVDTALLSPEQGVCADQYLEIKGSFWPIGFNKICGINPDQHFYIHMDKELGQEYVDVSITTTRGNKPWKFGMWISQIDCTTQSPIMAPAGCSQYYMGQVGVVKTFNFEGVQYLANHNYRICIRAERNACYTSFEADPNQFSLQLYLSDDNRRFNGNRATRSNRLPSGRGEEDCGLDYILIPGGKNETSSLGRTYDRFCGGYLNIDSAEEYNMPIYTRISSPIVWLQFVSGSRSEVALRHMQTTRNRVNNSFFFFGGGGGNSAVRDVNRNFSRAGPGLRLRYSQINSCPNDNN